MSAFYTLAVSFLLAITPLVQAAQHAVTVGGPGGLKFEPEFVVAEVGDTVLFTFKQKNHTATQSSFESPCSHIDGGFDSGFVPVQANVTDGAFPAAELTVIDANPIWVFCAQAGHCNAGMVFAVNPAEKFAAFKATAMGNTTTTPTSAPSSASVNATQSATFSSAASSSSIASSSSTALSASASSVSASSSVSNSSTVASSTASSSSAPSVTESTTSSSVSSASSITSIPPLTEEPLPGPSTLSPSPTPASATSMFTNPPQETSSDHHVIVGGTGLLAFSPPNVKAAPGDTITFQFRQTNHTATASSFNSPCTPLEGPGAFDSGYMAVAVDALKFPTFTIQVNSTEPIWVFCQQGNHCSSGMVFAVNAPVSKTVANNFDAFLAKAKGSKTGGTNGSTGSPSTNNSTSGSSKARSSSAGVALLSILVGLFIL